MSKKKKAKKSLTQPTMPPSLPFQQDISAWLPARLSPVLCLELASFDMMCSLGSPSHVAVYAADILILL